VSVVGVSLAEDLRAVKLSVRRSALLLFWELLKFSSVSTVGRRERPVVIDWDLATCEPLGVSFDAGDFQIVPPAKNL